MTVLCIVHTKYLGLLDSSTECVVIICHLSEVPSFSVINDGICPKEEVYSCRRRGLDSSRLMVYILGSKRFAVALSRSSWTPLLLTKPPPANPRFIFTLNALMTVMTSVYRRAGWYRDLLYLCCCSAFRFGASHQMCCLVNVRLRSTPWWRQADCSYK
jgi:hypothetical protein